MTQTASLIFALAAGMGLGAMFFGGLWWTLRRGLSSERPALWFFVSLLVRTSLTVAGFFLVSGGQWQRLVAGLAGFFIARLLATRLSRPPTVNPHPPAPEARHAAHS